MNLPRALVLIALCCEAATAAAQNTKAPATKTAAPATKTVAPAQDAKTAGTKQGTKVPATKQPGLAVAPEAAPRPRVPVIMREIYDYDAEERRDPFVTLLTTTELRPTVADLTLVGVLLDPRRPIAVMRDAGDNNRQYRVTTGMMLGRMRVAQIKRRTVIFSIEEFGLNRLDSLMLGDTTKARAK